MKSDQQHGWMDTLNLILSVQACYFLCYGFQVCSLYSLCLLLPVLWIGILSLYFLLCCSPLLTCLMSCHTSCVCSFPSIVCPALISLMWSLFPIVFINSSQYPMSLHLWVFLVWFLDFAWLLHFWFYRREKQTWNCCSLNVVKHIWNVVVLT